MRPVHIQDEQLLKDAMNFTFSKPVTAYLTEARMTACCCIGVTHRHIRADLVSGRFTDGRLIRTSDILRVRKEGGFWVLHTYSGSFYVIASFHIDDGYRSLIDYRILLTSGYQPTSDRLH